MFPILFNLGPITLHTYGLLVALGFLAAYYLARIELPKNGLPAELMDRITLPLMLSALFGARVVYFVLSGENMSSFFRLWEGGLVFYGGFIGAFTYVLIFCRIKKISILKLADALVAPLLLGQAIGRLGCFAAGCCYGKPTSSFLGVPFTSLDSLAPRLIPLHPTQLYSSLGDFLLLGGIFLIRKHLQTEGFKTAYYLVGYGAGRFLIEFLRDDFRGPLAGGFSPGQWISLGAIIIGVILFRYSLKAKKDFM